jgi:hypothetical protein
VVDASVGTIDPFVALALGTTTTDTLPGAPGPDPEHQLEDNSRPGSKASNEHEGLKSVNGKQRQPVSQERHSHRGVADHREHRHGRGSAADDEAHQHRHGGGGDSESADMSPTSDLHGRLNSRYSLCGQFGAWSCITVQGSWILNALFVSCSFGGFLI